MRYYVYHLIDPSNGKIFYVGKGTGNRMYNHEALVRKGEKPNNNTRLYDKILSIIESGFDIIYSKVFETDVEIDAYGKEFEEIERVGIDNLTNISTKRMYQGISYNVKVGLKNSEKNKARLEYIKSEEYRERCKNNNIGSKNPFYGKKWSTKQRAAIIEANQNPKTEEHKRNISEALKAYKKTEAHKENISAGLRNSTRFQEKIKSQEYRQKQSIKSTGARNSNAKEYIFTSPDGVEYIVKGGFDKFCLENNLSRSSMISVKNGNKESHKGWKVRELIK